MRAAAVWLLLLACFRGALALSRCFTLGVRSSKVIPIGAAPSWVSTGLRKRTRSVDVVRSGITQRGVAPLASSDDEQEREGKSEGTSLTAIGSKEYYRGFMESPLNTPPGEDLAQSEDRGDGLEQALKLGGGAAALLAFLFVGFMASNGLI